MTVQAFMQQVKSSLDSIEKEREREKETPEQQQGWSTEQRGNIV